MSPITKGWLTTFITVRKHPSYGPTIATRMPNASCLMMGSQTLNNDDDDDDEQELGT